MAIGTASASNAPSFGGSGQASLPDTPTVTGTATIAAVGDCQRVDINVTGEVTGVTDLGGGIDQIRVTVWDDGVEEDFAIVDVPVGDTVTYDVDLSFEGVVQQVAAGVGVFVIDGPDMDFNNELFGIDPFNPTEVQGTCGPVAEPISVPVNGKWALGLMV
ncbi:MAG: hypothetical protein GVY11_00455, partial [Gammaproteobacteria bacterium]|nr:hypothetical protein [Gammaproteobacteria bacterium]